MQIMHGERPFLGCRILACARKPARSPGVRSGGVLLCGRQLPGEVAGVRYEVCWLGQLAGERLFRPWRSR
jgi:hypothetical protein